MILARLAESDEELRTLIDFEPAKDRSGHCARVLFKLFHAGLSVGEALVVATGSAFAAKFDGRKSKWDLATEVEEAYERWKASVDAPQDGKPVKAKQAKAPKQTRVEPQDEPEEAPEGPPSPPPPPPSGSGETGEDDPSAGLRSEQSGLMAHLNKLYALVRSYGGKTVVLHEGRDERRDPKEYWQSVGDFHTVAATEPRVCVGFKANGEPKYIPASKWWLTKKKRREYQDVIFEPSTNDRNVNGHYNLEARLVVHDAGSHS